jgi:hypothetical protein
MVAFADFARTATAVAAYRYKGAQQGRRRSTGFVPLTA